MDAKSTEPTVADRLPRKRKRGFKIFLLLVVLGGLGVAGWLGWRYHGPSPEVQIFQGLTYGCERLADSNESGGLLHWVRADLNVKGVELFVTPMDPEAHARHYEYKLKYTSSAVALNHLAVAVNGTLFAADAQYLRLPGDDATSNETLVSNHVYNHVHQHTYLLWWDDDLIAHLEPTKPPSAEVLAKAKWAIGGQQPLLLDGQVRDNAGRSTDQRTMIAADPARRLVWIACFDKASYHFAGITLAKMGAKIGVLVDGGSSTAMVLGDEAKNVRLGTVTGNWRPVATHFGFRGLPLRTDVGQ